MELETLKLDVFTNIDVLQDISNNLIFDILKNGKKTPKSFAQMIDDKNINIEDTTIDNYRKYIIGLFIEYKTS
jgi:hypothetical protein